MRQLLSDVTVLELASDPAGSYCGKVFADLGSDVVKVETPAGDPERQHPERYQHLNTNKRAVRIGDDDAGRAQLLELVGAVDVVIESKGAGDLAAFGLVPRDVRAEFPTLVVVTISGFGTTGPYADYTWSDLAAQTAAWVTFPQGRSLEVPVRAPRIAALCSVGHTAALGALAGTLRARTSGAGAHVDVAAFEALGSIPARVCRYLGWEYAEHEPLGLAANAADTLLPVGIFPCGDGYVSMMSTPQQLKEMLEVLDDDALEGGVLEPRRVLEPGDQGDPRHRAVSVAVRAHARRGHRQGPGGPMATRRRLQPRRGHRGRPLPPARVLGRLRRPRARRRAAGGPAVPLRRGWLAAPPPRARAAAPNRASRCGGASARHPARRAPTCHRCAASASSTSPPSGRALTSRSSSPTSAPR